MDDPFAQPPVGVPPGAYGPPPPNGVATAAMVIGIIAILPAVTIVFAVLAVFPGIVALILGFVGLSNANRHPARPGRGMAITGIVLGGLTVVALVIEIVLFAIVLDSVDVNLVDQHPAEVDDYEISGRSCAVRRDQAMASGVLTNRSGAPHAFILDVRFEDGDRTLGTRRDSIESPWPTAPNGRGTSCSLWTRRPASTPTAWTAASSKSTSPPSTKTTDPQQLGGGWLLVARRPWAFSSA